MNTIKALKAVLALTGRVIKTAWSWISTNVIYFQGLTALALAVGLFWGSMFPLAAIGTESFGVFDPGWLQLPILGAVLFLAITFLAWFAIQLDWPDLNRYVDSDEGFKKDLDALTPAQRVLLLVSVFFGLVALAVVCVFVASSAQ